MHRRFDVAPVCALIALAAGLWLASAPPAGAQMMTPGMGGRDRMQDDQMRRMERDRAIGTGIGIGIGIINEGIRQQRERDAATPDTPPRRAGKPEKKPPRRAARWCAPNSSTRRWRRPSAN